MTDYDFFWDKTDPGWDDADILAFVRGLRIGVIEFKGKIKCEKKKNALLIAEIALTVACCQKEANTNE